MRDDTIRSRKHKNLWVLIADGKEAKIYHGRRIDQKTSLQGLPRPTHQEAVEYELIPVSEMASESINDYQIGHNRRGTSSSSFSSAHNTYEPQGDIRKELQRRYIKTIVAYLEQAYAEKVFDFLILVAPAKMIGALREQFSVQVKNRIAAVLPKELTHCQGNDLLQHLQDTFAEANLYERVSV